MDAELFVGREVTLDALLDARERRSVWQMMLCKRHAGSVVVLTAVTPGAVKNHAVSRAVMAQGMNLFARLCDKYGFAVQAHYHWQEDAGEAAWWCVAADAHTLKRALIALEESLPTARLWDFDVLDDKGTPLSRQALGFAPRRCLVCADAAKNCARERRHDAYDVQAAIGQRLQQEAYALALAEAMEKALVAEANLTPKPGLSDRLHHDCHPDMPPDVLIASAHTLKPFLAAMALAGMTHEGFPDAALLARIRAIGRAGETAMLRTTQGVNTHRGALFAFGLLASVRGWQYRHDAETDEGATRAHLRALCAILPQELAALAAQAPAPHDSAGVKLYRAHGLGGARMQAAGGFAAVFDHALPVYRTVRDVHGAKRAALTALLALIAVNGDSTTVFRGGMAALAWAQQEAESLLSRAGRLDERAFCGALTAFDAAAAHRRLSFGGSADLPALTLFLAGEGRKGGTDPAWNPLHGRDAGIYLPLLCEESYGQENPD